jgi:hypothetical protein
MFNDRLQPERTVLAVTGLFIGVVALGLAAGAGRAGQTPATTPATTDKVKALIPSLSPKVNPDQTQARASTKSSRKEPAETKGAELSRTTTPSMQSSAAGRRDPFRPFVTPATGGHPAAGGMFGSLPAGVRGLVISELRVEGLVRLESANDMIAMVTNSTKRAYFLRVNDTVYNGVVSKITPEAVYFKENTLNLSGRVTTHEVEIKLGAAPGEGR